MALDVWAIDPGGYDAKQKSSGLAIFKRLGVVGPWQLVSIESLHAPTLLGRIMDDTRRPVIVYEGWRSNPYSQGGSEQPTAMTIGALRWICDYRNLVTVKQMNNDKPRALTLMAKHGIELTGSNQHKRDAEMHGWYYLLRKAS